MIISRTPYRISYFGGGTDYHSWYQQHGGAVLTSTINHYCYLNCRFLPPFFEYKTRVSWSKLELVNTNNQISHPAVRAILNTFNINSGVEIQHQGDLPARSGLGTSSAFTVGLLYALYRMLDKPITKKQLACEAVHLERDIMQENVGVQDQIETAYGGINKINISPDGHFDVIPLNLSAKRQKDLQEHLLLFFTGVSRTASDIAADQIKCIPNKKAIMQEMQRMVDEACLLLKSNTDICEFGRLLDETWQLKRSISDYISPSYIDEIYAKARRAGAIGGKLLGAGGGGFMLFFVKPEQQADFLQQLSDLLVVPFNFENNGSQIIFEEKTTYSHRAMTQRNFIHLNKQFHNNNVHVLFDKKETLNKIPVVE